MQRNKKFCLSIFNYNNEVVCELYDNQSDIVGQATNVHIISERNGWKELNFDIPSTYLTEEGYVDNYRLKYLISEYKIKATDGNKIDWFIISEPQIKHSNFSKNVSVRAGHVSQLLKHKNLDLEFSDEEGNSVGTAEKLLETILAGTGWTVGHVGEQNEHGEWHTFLEDDNVTAKQRSITASAGTGALSLIEKLCDTFEAKPVYRIEDKQYVDILPMNPFAKVQPEQIPYISRDKDLDVLELCYDRNIHSLTKTTNTDNMATRLYAYGSFGDMDGACTLQNATHYEWTIIAPETREGEFRFTIADLVYYFTASLDENDELVWSNMDLTSMSYIYNNTQKIAYEIYKSPKTQNISILNVSESVEKANNFSFLFGLQYYKDVGLMTDEQFQEVAKFQREMPEIYEVIKEASENYIKSEAELSSIAEHSTGLLKLKIDEIIDNKYIIDTSVGEHGVIYRTDYDKAERRYFMWHVTDKLNSYGDPITGTPSLLFIVHNTDPVTYDMTYLKEIWDTNGEVLDNEGNPKDFEYSTGNYPVSFTVWNNNIRFSSETDRVYLLCTNSMTGELGARLSQIEAVHQDLYNSTMKHPVLFFDGDNLPAIIPTSENVEYEWRYDYHISTVGELYFRWKDKFDEDEWKRVYISDNNIDPVSNSYFYNTRLKHLYRAGINDDETVWTRIEDKQTIVNMFETVIYYCYRHDELYRGIYEYYYHNYPEEIGNYAIFDGYNAYWTFKLNQKAEYNLLMDYKDNNVYLDVEFEDNNPIINTDKVVSPSSVECRSVFYLSDNELRGRNFQPGSINDEGIDTTDSDNKYKTGYLVLENNQEYIYFLPADSAIYLYDENHGFIQKISITSDYILPDQASSNYVTSGTFNSFNASYMRIVVPSILQTAFVKKSSQEESVNLLENIAYANGTLDNDGQDVDIRYYRSYNIEAYENTSYEYYLPERSTVFYYDVNSKFISFDSLTTNISEGTFTTPANTRYFRIVSSTNDMSSYYIHVVNYDKVFYMNREQYRIIDTVPMGDLIGITPLTKMFADAADAAYEQYLPVLQEAQSEAKDEEDTLAVLLGDMLKDGRWQDSNYIKGDEKRLYDDALYMLRQVSMPETSYSFTYLDMFGIQNEHHFEENDIEWPNVSINQIAHLIDPEININCWAYIDKVDKYYDQPWKTQVEIDTKLTLAARHNFTDVIARIAEVSKEMKAKQTLYDQATTGTVDGSRVEGTIQLNKVYLDGGASNWYNDKNGNLVFESADGLSAVQIGGRGIGISTERTDDGGWLWRTAATGYGLTADVLTTGYISTDRINAGTITLDKLSSNIGKELEISSNSALMLFATEDGSKPAGSLKTTDGYIRIQAGKENTPAAIDVVSGGELNLAGGKLNVHSEGEMNVSSGGKFVLQSLGADSIDSETNGLFIDSNVGVNFGGGKFKVKKNGDAMDVSIKANTIELGDENSSCIKMNSSNQTIDITALRAINIDSQDEINIFADQVLNLTTNDIIKIGKNEHLFTIGADDKRAFIYYNVPTLDSNNQGLYIGTDGFSLNQYDASKNVITKLIAANGTISLTAGIDDDSKNDFVSISATDANYRIWAGKSNPSAAPFSVKKTGYLFASSGKIGGFDMTANRLSSGDGDFYIALDSNTSKNDAGEYNVVTAIWCGNKSASKAPFRVQKDGTLIAQKGTIGGFTMESNLLHSGSGAYYVGLRSSGTDTNYAIWCGAETASEANFRVTRGGNVYMKNAIISGGSISIKDGDTENFKVTSKGVVTMRSASIIGGTITLKDGDQTNFKVTSKGILTAVGATLNLATMNSAEINGGSFTVYDSEHKRYLFAINANNNGKMFIGASQGNGFMIDPNDFTGPWQGSLTSGVNKNSSGFIQINCNPKNNKRIAAGKGGNQFYVRGDGYLWANEIHCNAVVCGGTVYCASVNGRVI